MPLFLCSAPTAWAGLVGTVFLLGGRGRHSTTLSPTRTQRMIMSAKCPDCGLELNGQTGCTRCESTDDASPSAHAGMPPVGTRRRIKILPILAELTEIIVEAIARRRIKILFLAANPDDRTRLELGREYIQVRDELLRGKHRDDFQLLNPELSAKIQDLTTALVWHQPHVVHFCGHGSKDQGLVFECEEGYSRPASTEEVTLLFKTLSRNARLIFLNACHTKEQSEALSRIFDYTIGTNGLIHDGDAVKFAGEFYRTLANGATVEGTFQAARAAMNGRVSGISELLKREGADDSSPFISQVLERHRSSFAYALRDAIRKLRMLVKQRWAEALLVALLVLVTLGGVLGFGWPGFLGRPRSNAVPTNPQSISLPEPELLEINGQPAQGVGTLYTGRSRLVNFRVKGRLKGSLPEGYGFYVARLSEGYALQAWRLDDAGQDVWQTQAKFEVPEGTDSTRLEMVPIVTKGVSELSGAAVADLKRKGHGVTVEIKAALLMIDSFEQKGAYADLAGKASNLPDGTKLVIETTATEAAAVGSDTFQGRATAEITKGEWHARDVPMRDANRPGGKIKVRVSLSPEEGRAHAVEEISSDSTNASVGEPSVRITHINAQQVTGDTRCEIEPGTTVMVRGAGENLLDGDTVWLKVYGEGAGAGHGMWPPTRGEVSKRSPDGKGGVTWSTKVHVGDGENTWTKFSVLAGACTAPPDGSKERFDSASGCLVICGSGKKVGQL